ncbi:MAG: YgeY family selenium metabolism-linked hydrolase [Spirochaetales bacterium]|nr:YgeY family selenium metabolism-linked hydrolase [Spirochaetales bacterium]
MTDNELYSLLSSLVSTYSVSGNEKEIVDLLDDKLSSLGFVTERMESGSICGVINGNRPGPVVLLDAHIDTVGVPDKSKWTHDPFSLTRDGSRIYGRGTSDMKGGLAAIIGGASEFVNKDFPGKIVVSCIVEEERFEGICSREVSERYKPDYVVIAESTEGKLKIGQRGRCEIILEAEGKSCHSSNPEEGINAIRVMMDAIRALDEIEVPEDEMLGKGIMVLTDIISSPYPGASVIPEKCFATFDRRTLVGETAESVLSPINAILEKKGIKARARIAEGVTDTYTRHHLEAPRFFPSWKMKEDDDSSVRAKKGLESVGLWKGFSHYSFCTNGSHYAGEKGIPTVGYGPGEERFAHIVDEYIEEEDLYKAKRGIEGIIKGFLGLV